MLRHRGVQSGSVGTISREAVEVKEDVLKTLSEFDRDMKPSVGKATKDKMRKTIITGILAAHKLKGDSSKRKRMNLLPYLSLKEDDVDSFEIISKKGATKWENIPAITAVKDLMLVHYIETEEEVPESLLKVRGAVYWDLGNDTYMKVCDSSKYTPIVVSDSLKVESGVLKFSAGHTLASVSLLKTQCTARMYNEGTVLRIFKCGGVIHYATNKNILAEGAKDPSGKWIYRPARWASWHVPFAETFQNALDTVCPGFLDSVYPDDVLTSPYVYEFLVSTPQRMLADMTMCSEGGFVTLLRIYSSWSAEDSIGKLKHVNDENVPGVFVGAVHNPWNLPIPSGKRVFSKVPSPEVALSGPFVIVPAGVGLVGIILEVTADVNIYRDTQEVENVVSPFVIIPEAIQVVITHKLFDSPHMKYISWPTENNEIYSLAMPNMEYGNTMYIKSDDVVVEEAVRLTDAHKYPPIDIEECDELLKARPYAAVGEDAIITDYRHSGGGSIIIEGLDVDGNEVTLQVVSRAYEYRNALFGNNYNTYERFIQALDIISDANILNEAYVDLLSFSFPLAILPRNVLKVINLAVRAKGTIRHPIQNIITGKGIRNYTRGDLIKLVWYNFILCSNPTKLVYAYNMLERYLADTSTLSLWLLSPHRQHELREVKYLKDIWKFSSSKTAYDEAIRMTSSTKIIPLIKKARVDSGTLKESILITEPDALFYADLEDVQEA